MLQGTMPVTVGSRADQVVDLIELYDHLRCDTTKPIGAVECVSTTLLDKENKTPLAERAESCMRKAGTTVPLRLWVLAV